MPELPEVEVTRLSFAQRIAGARILHLQLGKPLRWPLGCDPALLAGRQVQQVRRRGKYLLLDMDKGLLLMHLGMSGSLRFAPSVEPAGPHDHMDLHTDRGVLRLHDPRRFGAVVYSESESAPQAHKLLQNLGVEPLEDGFTPAVLHQGLKERRAPIKQVLLAGDVVVGVGNIYASEALFHAGIRPTTAANRVSLPRATRLHAAIRQILAAAVASGGSSLRDFVDAHGEPGYFQLHTMVYDKEGHLCRICATPIRRIRQGQRSTFYCPICQKP